MQTGVSISAAAHVSLIALVIFGGPIFDAKKKDVRLQVTDVTLVSAAVLDAVASRAPQAPRTETDAPVPPRDVDIALQTPGADVSPPSEPSPEQPTSSVETPPDLTEIATAPETAVQPIVEPAETPEAPAQPVGLGGVSPVAIAGQDVPVSPDALALAEPPKPSDAPRIDTTAAPKPPTDAIEAETATPEVAPDEMSIEPEPERPAEAPPEATVEISPDPVESEPVSAAPLASRRPRGRPVTLARAAPPSETAPVAAASKPDEPPENTQTATAASTLPVRPPLNSGEIDGLRLSIKKCWSVPAGLRDAEQLEVVVGVTLSQSGEIVGDNVRWLEPSDQSDARFKAAYRAARTAILRCQPYEMPREKYAQWKDLEVVFNPKGMKGLW